MEIHVISPEGNHIYTNISEVSIPTTSGRITIRPDHVNITTTLAEWKMTRTDDTTVSDLESFADQTKQMHIPGGIALFSDERLEIITSNTLL